MIKRWRALAATPGMLLTAVATLGIGIGLNATLFAIIFPSAARTQKDLLRVRKTSSISAEDAYQIALHLEWFRAAFEQRKWETRLGAEPVRGLIVAENYFQALGISSSLSAESPVPEILLSRRAALSLFSWPFAPVGRVVDLGGCRVRIAGTAPGSFTGAESAPSDFWIFEQSARQCSAASHAEGVDVIARLRPGLDPPASLGDYTFQPVRSFKRLSNARQGVSPLALAFILCLTIPCINVANLMLARSLSKQRDTGIRLALGASRRQIAEIVMGDGIAIGILGAVVAFPVAWIGVRIAELLMFFGATELAAAGLRTNLPITHLDPMVFAACLASGVLAAVLFSVGPALRAAAQTVNESLRGEVAGMRIPRLLKSMALVQTSFCALVIAISAALLWNVHELASVDPGYRSRGVAAIYGSSELIENQPGIASSALTTETLNISVNGQDARTTVISAGYFNTLGIPLREGRDFTAAEADGSAGLAIVSQSTAQAWWPGGNAIGKSIDLDPFDLRVRELPADESHRHVKIIGVAGDVISGSLWEGIDRYRVYLPGVMKDRQNQLIRVSNPEDLNRIATQVSGRGFMVTFDQKVASDRYLARSVAIVSVALGVLMLALALSGMYSMLALTTELRMKEFAIRSAMGATPRSLFGTVTGSATLLSITGGAIGLAIFVVLDFFLLPQLAFPLRGSRVVVYVSVSLVMLGVGLVSALEPGLRASRSDVATLLRESAG